MGRGLGRRPGLRPRSGGTGDDAFSGGCPMSLGLEERAGDDARSQSRAPRSSCCARSRGLEERAGDDPRRDCCGLSRFLGLGEQAGGDPGSPGLRERAGDDPRRDCCGLSRFLRPGERAGDDARRNRCGLGLSSETKAAPGSGLVSGLDTSEFGVLLERRRLCAGLKMGCSMLRARGRRGGVGSFFISPPLIISGRLALGGPRGSSIFGID